MITEQAAKALANGDALGALGLVGRLDSVSGLVLRGIAYAQLGDLSLARASLSEALSREGSAIEHARARAALVEILLLDGDPSSAAEAARASIAELTAMGDARNAMMQELVLARAEVLLGRLNEARHVVETMIARRPRADLLGVAWFAMAEIEVRAVSATRARAAMASASRALKESPHPLLSRALASLESELSKPIARIVRGGDVAPASLEDVERSSRGDVLLVDACRMVVVGGRVTVPLSRRPILFALLETLGRAWPASIPREELCARGFGVRRVNASHISRLRVELGRLRKLLEGTSASPVAEGDGYALSSTRDVVLLAPLTDDEGARISILLGDGAAWSAQSLAEHTGTSKRTAQRVLGALVESGAVERTGKGKDLRYTRTAAPIASKMVLLGLVPRP